MSNDNKRFFFVIGVLWVVFHLIAVGLLALGAPEPLIAAVIIDLLAAAVSVACQVAKGIWP